MTSATCFSQVTRHLLHHLLLRTFLGFLPAIALFLGQTGSASELLINGSFEVPVVPSSPSTARIITVTGSEPPGFGWQVDVANVEIKAQGYAGGSSGEFPFNGPAYHADQWLDLNGYPSPGAISQTFATVAGAQYALSFAYANNPYRLSDATATVSVLNVGDNVDLITPLVITHGSSEVDDYHWTLSGPILFTAQGPSTRLSFVSNDPANFDGDKGILLDAISVADVPEPSTSLLAGLGLSGLGILAWRRRCRRDCFVTRAVPGLMAALARVRSLHVLVFCATSLSLVGTGALNAAVITIPASVDADIHTGTATIEDALDLVNVSLNRVGVFEFDLAAQIPTVPQSLAPRFVDSRSRSLTIQKLT